MTKLFVMYAIMEEIEKGNASLSDIVPLPPETWAANQPPHSSLMFLGKNQKATLEEIITGLDVCSGNDAANAIALYLFGDVDSFVQKINQIAVEQKNQIAKEQKKRNEEEQKNMNETQE